MDITTTSLLANQLQTLDPKATAKENATKIIQETKDIPLTLSAQETPLAPSKNTQEVVGQLLSSAVSEVKSKSGIFQILQHHPLFKNMGNFAEDVKTLTSLVKVDSTVAKPLALLQLFTKSIEQMDVKAFRDQVQNSGIFFESKLANLVTQKGVQETLQTLIDDLKEHLTSVTKTPSMPLKELQNAIEQLNKLDTFNSKDAQATLKSLLDTVRQSMKEQSAAEPTSRFAETYNSAKQLEYAAKQIDLIVSKMNNYPSSMKIEEHFNTHVKVLLELVKDQLSTLGADDLKPLVEQLLQKESFTKAEGIPNVAVNTTLDKEAFALPKMAPHIPSTQASELEPTLEAHEEAVQAPKESEKEILDVPKGLLETDKNAMLLQKESIPSQMTSTPLQKPETIEDALKMVANRIKQQIELQEPKLKQHADFLEKSSALEQKVHSLIKPELFVGKAMVEKLSLDPTDVELLSDMKGVLTKLSDSLPPTPQNKEALEVTQRLLTQIEYHQLFSYVSSSTHVYIPFSWEGMKNGSMMMKQSSDENFHCQIDLDLEHYGRLNMMLVLSNEKYIDLSIAVQKKELSEKISSELHTLKQALNEVGLVTSGVKMLEYKEVNIVKNDYFNGENLQFGINLKI